MGKKTVKFQDSKYGLLPVSTPNSWHRPLNLISLKPLIPPPPPSSLYCIPVFPHPPPPSFSNYTQSQKTVLSIKHSTVTFSALSLTSLSVCLRLCWFQAGLSEQCTAVLHAVCVWVCLHFRVLSLAFSVAGVAQWSSAHAQISYTFRSPCYGPWVCVCVSVSKNDLDRYWGGKTFYTDKATHNHLFSMDELTWESQGFK